MNYCRAIVNFFSMLNDWKSEDKLQYCYFEQMILLNGFLQLLSNDIALKSATLLMPGKEPNAGFQIKNMN
jgi:hypothetical protein